MRKKIIEHYGDTDTILFADGFDDCIIGFEPDLWKVVYSRNKCVDSMESDGMGTVDALEYLEFNTFSAHFGDKTPIWVEDFKWKEVQ
jgi:hypothetical protein